MLFIDNKYTRTYYKLIVRAKARVITDYTEKHHIIPKSLGGTDSKDNLVKLTAREHFICHLLLTKMTTGNNTYKMKFALSMITKIKNIGEGRYTPSGKLYEYARKSYKESLDYLWTEEKRKEHAAKSRIASAGRKHSSLTIEKMKNKKWTEKAINTRIENCRKAAARRKGKLNPSHGDVIFRNYVNNNKEIIQQIWKLADTGLNRRKISIKLGISWDRVNLAINKKPYIEKMLEN